MRCGLGRLKDLVGRQIRGQRAELPVASRTCSIAEHFVDSSENTEHSGLSCCTPAKKSR
jgi:hypothetical protein